MLLRPLEESVLSMKSQEVVYHKFQKNLEKEAGIKIVKKFRISTLQRPFDLATFSKDIIDDVAKLIEFMDRVSKDQLFLRSTID